MSMVFIYFLTTDYALGWGNKMHNKRESKPESIDSNLYEDLDDEEMEELVRQAQLDMFLEESNKKPTQATSRHFSKWIIWLIAIVMIINTFSFVLQTYSIPAIEFLKASAKLSKNEQVSSYKKSVVTILSGDSKGTGFSISSDGMILTNYHVIEGDHPITVIFPDDGRFTASVVHTDPAVDLALLATNGDNLPSLELAKQTSIVENEQVYFIGNPLRFHGIANEGKVIDYLKLHNWEDEVVMIKAPIYRGNSGSPIINQDGNVIGVIFATLKHDDYGKVGLFIPIDYYYRMLNN